MKYIVYIVRLFFDFYRFAVGVKSATACAVRSMRALLGLCVRYSVYACAIRNIVVTAVGMGRCTMHTSAVARS